MDTVLLIIYNISVLIVFILFIWMGLGQETKKNIAGKMKGFFNK